MRRPSSGRSCCTTYKVRDALCSSFFFFFCLASSPSARSFVHNGVASMAWRCRGACDTGHETMGQSHSWANDIEAEFAMNLLRALGAWNAPGPNGSTLRVRCVGF